MLDPPSPFLAGLSRRTFPYEDPVDQADESDAASNDDEWLDAETVDEDDEWELIEDFGETDDTVWR